MKESFTCQWLKDMEFTLILKGLPMLDTGSLINSMEGVRRSLEMALSMMGITMKDLNKEKESTSGLLIRRAIRASGIRVGYMGLVNICGAMADHTLAIGIQTKWKGLGSMCYQTLRPMKDSSLMKRSKDMDISSGQMEGSIKVGGGEANSMVLVYIMEEMAIKRKLSMDYGRWERESSGSLLQRFKPLTKMIWTICNTLLRGSQKIRVMMDSQSIS
jgi:hypothetical protein